MTLVPAILRTALHVLPHFSASSTTVISQVCFGLPLLLAPFWFQSNACFLTDSSRFLIVWPTNRYFLILIRTIVAIITPHISVLLFILGHLMPIILREYRFTNICNLFVICVITFHVPHPYNSTELTWILNILFLVFISVFLFSHNVCSSTKIPLYLLIRALTYWSAPPSAVTALPTHVNCSTLTW